MEANGYDFRRCKLCGESKAAAKYKLKGMNLYACARCDFHYIDALDDYPEEQSGEELLTEGARNFIAGKLPQNARQLQTDLQFVKALIDLPGKSCLDIGSGVGLFASFLQQEGAEVQAIEPQQIFREYAQEKFQISCRRELVEDPYWQNSFADSFDVITLWDTLEHVNFPVETLQAASKLLNPGGLLFLDTPSRDSLFYRSSEWSYRFSSGTKPLLLNKLYSSKPYRHKQIFSRKQLWTLLEVCGFDNIEQSPLHQARKKFVIAGRKTAEKNPA